MVAQKKYGGAMAVRRRRRSRAGRRGITILETIVSLLVFLVGIVALLNYFPHSLQTYHDAMDVSVAALLANMKAEEVRRDDDRVGTLRSAIALLDGPTAPITFPQETRMAYSFSGRSLLAPEEEPGVARVIIRYAGAFDPGQKVLYEMPLY